VHDFHARERRDTKRTARTLRRFVHASVLPAVTLSTSDLLVISAANEHGLKDPTKILHLMSDVAGSEIKRTTDFPKSKLDALLQRFSSLNK
jgi:hypothetical protein